MSPIPAIAPLRFRNDTAFDAIHFDMLDQHDTAFHVIVARIGFRFGPCGSDGLATLVPLDLSPALLGQDRHHDANIECSVRVESDLAPYKPRCDVVVVGDAHAPAGHTAATFPIVLRVQYRDRLAPQPEPPRPPNPLQTVSQEARQRWHAEAQKAAGQIIPGQRFIDKILHVTGPRELRRRSAAAVLPLRAIGQCPWKLTQSAPVQRVPVRYEYAQGGQARVERGSAAAQRVPQRFRLSQEQSAQSGEGAPVAHDACQHNPVGKGFAPAWYLDAAEPACLPAPQIEYPNAPFTSDLFWKASRGMAELTPAGFGFVGRAWRPRRDLVGTMDVNAAWGVEDVPRLPPDFDFGYWNGAPADQQCEHLTGAERFIVVNMTPPGANWARLDASGHGVLTFELPRQSLFVLAADAEGAVAAMPLAVDTVLIDTLAGTVELTWRLCVPADGEIVEARLLHAATPEQLDRLTQWTLSAAAA